MKSFDEHITRSEQEKAFTCAINGIDYYKDNKKSEDDFESKVNQWKSMGLEQVKV